MYINLCRIRGYKYYGITSTSFGTGTQRVSFPTLAYLSLPGKKPNKFLYLLYIINLACSIIKLPNDIYILFAFEKKIRKILIFKEHAETLRSIVKTF